MRCSLSFDCGGCCVIIRSASGLRVRKEKRRKRTKREKKKKKKREANLEHLQMQGCHPLISDLHMRPMRIA